MTTSRGGLQPKLTILLKVQVIDQGMLTIAFSKRLTALLFFALLVFHRVDHFNISDLYVAVVIDSFAG